MTNRLKLCPACRLYRNAEPERIPMEAAACGKCVPVLIKKRDEQRRHIQSKILIGR